VTVLRTTSLRLVDTAAPAGLVAAFAAVALGRGLGVVALLAVVAVSVAVLALAQPRLAITVALPAALLVPPTVVLHLGRLPDQTPLRALTALCFVAAVCASIVSHRSRAFSVPRAPAAAFGVFAVVVLALALRHPTVSAVREGFAVTFGAAAPAALALWAARTERDAWRAVRAVVAAADVAVAIAVVEELRGSYLIPAVPGIFFHADARAGWLRAQGVFPHPIVYGSVLALSLPLAIGVWLSSPAGRRRTFGGASALLIGGGLVLSLSRGPWLAAAVGVVVVAVAAGRVGVRVAAPVLGATILFALSPLAPPAIGAVQELVHPHSTHDAYTSSYRAELFHQIWSYTSAHPLRAHLDLHDHATLPGHIAGRAVDFTVSVDNAYAYYALQLSLVAAVLLIVLLLVLAATTLHATRLSEGSARTLGAAVLGAQVSVLVVSATVASISWDQLGVLFWFVSGLGLSLAARPELRTR
jgi:hypothetical protein